MKTQFVTVSPAPPPNIGAPPLQVLLLKDAGINQRAGIDIFDGVKRMNLAWKVQLRMVGLA